MKAIFKKGESVPEWVMEQIPMEEQYTLCEITFYTDCQITEVGDDYEIKPLKRQISFENNPTIEVTGIGYNVEIRSNPFKSGKLKFMAISVEEDDENLRELQNTFSDEGVISKFESSRYYKGKQNV